jgi:drug/metabolite transporter (DMT)-like permease
MGALIIISALFGLIVLPMIAIIQPNVFAISVENASILIVAAIISIFGILAYLYAIRDNEVSFVIPLFELIPVVSFILGYIFLQETLTIIQALGSALIIAGATVLGLELGGKITFKYRLVYLMLAAVVGFSINGLLFKYVAQGEDFWIATFWSYVGLVIAGIGFYLFIPSYRRDFRYTIKFSGKKVLSINFISESINAVASIIVNYALLLAPIALVYSVNSFQSVFVLLYGVLLTLFAPHIYKEDLSHKVLAQKIAGIVVVLVGAWLVNQ